GGCAAAPLRWGPPRAAGGGAAPALRAERFPGGAPPTSGEPREPIDPAAPAIPTGDDGSDEPAVLFADEQRVGVLANDALEIGQRVGRPRVGLGAFPELEHFRAFLQAALADRQRHDGTTSRASNSIAAKSSMSSVCSIT